MSKVLITGEDLTVEEIVAVCRQEALVELSDEAKENVRASRKIVDDLIAEEKVVYGITTGFGKFSDVVISQDQCKELQKNLIITHAVGAGEPFSRDIAASHQQPFQGIFRHPPGNASDSGGHAE